MSHKKGKSKKSRGITVEIDDLFGESGHGSGAYALPTGSSYGAPEALGLGSFTLSVKPTSKKERQKAAAAEKAAAEAAAAAAAAEKAASLAELRRRYDLQQQQLRSQLTKSGIPYSAHESRWFGEGPDAPKFVYIPDKNGHGGTRRTKSKSRSRSKSKRSRSRSRSRSKSRF
jgi:hypothetical protein